MMETLFGIQKRARNFYFERRSIGPERPTSTPFRPPFWPLPLVLVEAIPPLPDILRSSRLRGNLRETMQSIRKQSPDPFVVRQCLNCTIGNLSGLKTQALGGLPNKTCRASLSPQERSSSSFRHNDYRTKCLNRLLKAPKNREIEKGNVKNPRSDRYYHSSPPKDSYSPQENTKALEFGLHDIHFAPKLNKPHYNSISKQQAEEENDERKKAHQGQRKMSVSKEDFA